MHMIYNIICIIKPQSFLFLYNSDSNPYSSFGATLARDDEKNLWSMPHDVSHTEADDDRTLYNLIVIRNQQAKDSEVSTFWSLAVCRWCCIAKNSNSWEDQLEITKRMKDEMFEMKGRYFSSIYYHWLLIIASLDWPAWYRDKAHF